MHPFPDEASRTFQINFPIQLGVHCISPLSKSCMIRAGTTITVSAFSRTVKSG